MKTCVGLVVVTILPGLGRVAVMHKRGVYDFERMDWETWPEELQVSCFGCVNDTDPNLIDALGREAEEELGPEFRILLEERRGDLKILTQGSNAQRHSTIYGLSLPDPAWRQTIRLHSSSGGLFPFNREHRPPLRFFGDHETAALKGLDVL